MKTQFKINFIHISIDLVIVSLSLFISFYLRVGEHLFGYYWPVFTQFFLIYIIASPVVFSLMGLYKMIWRYVTANDALILSRAVFVSSLSILLISYLVEIKSLPRSVFIIHMLLSLVGLSAVRIMRRFLFEYTHKKSVKTHGRKTLIIGAGFNGRALAKRLRFDQSQRSNVIGFIDDNLENERRKIEEIPILGNTNELERIIHDYKIQQVAIGINQPPGELVQKTLTVCKKFNIKPQVVSQPDDLMNFNNSIRPIELKDLLNRPQRLSDFGAIKGMIENKKVLITGAGGSIGSEIARQILKFDPSKLVILDNSEYALYQVDKELRLNMQESNQITPALVDLKDADGLKNIFERYNPDIVFHAAAYKHVHLVESNPYSAILNNVQGTMNLLDLCESHSTSNFILISTDKAVNPVGVMGASKRICEILTAIKGLTLNKNYSSVRFGNVLGSSGSLIPLLQEQIAQGGPVTITHAEMTRYFMLIPEAVSLVLNAASLSIPGDLNVLKMGAPIKILDIAKSLITLMGNNADEFPIEFIGLRPGEKMYEELYINGNELKTKHPDILTVAKGDNIPVDVDFKTYKENILIQVNEMLELSKTSDIQAIKILNDLVNITNNSTDKSKDCQKLKILTIAH